MVGTTFCGSARQPLAPLFVRPPPAEPGGAPGPRRPPPGPGLGRQEMAGWVCRAAGPRSEIHLDPDTRHEFSPRVGNLFKHLFFFFLRKITNIASIGFQHGYGEGYSNANRKLNVFTFSPGFPELQTAPQN